MPLVNDTVVVLASLGDTRIKASKCIGITTPFLYQCLALPQLSSASNWLPLSGKIGCYGDFNPSE